MTAIAIAAAGVKWLCGALAVLFHSGCHRGFGSTCDYRGHPLDMLQSALRALNVAAHTHLHLHLINWLHQTPGRVAPIRFACSALWWL